MHHHLSRPVFELRAVIASRQLGLRTPFYIQILLFFWISKKNRIAIKGVSSSKWANLLTKHDAAPKHEEFFGVAGLASSHAPSSNDIVI